MRNQLPPRHRTDQHPPIPAALRVSAGPVDAALDGSHKAACWSHPFFSLVVCLNNAQDPLALGATRSELERLKQAYSKLGEVPALVVCANNCAPLTVSCKRGLADLPKEVRIAAAATCLNGCASSPDERAMVARLFGLRGAMGVENRRGLLHRGEPLLTGWAGASVHAAIPSGRG